MDETKARALLRAERARVEALLAAETGAGQEDRDAADDQLPGDIADPAEPLTDEEGDDAVVAQLREELAAIERAERRVDDGTYGRSVLSGQPIPDARLEADPTAELTTEEAQLRADAERPGRLPG
jgi:DnaK suppressor protein